jgi:hypothetical protein
VFVQPCRHVQRSPPAFGFRGWCGLAVRWYLCYGLSYRDVEELLAERGVQVDHVTIYRWVGPAVHPISGRHCPLGPARDGARRILEVGTLGGYSTIWLARALPTNGRLITLEIDPKYAKVARANIANAGLADHVEVRVGQALDACRSWPNSAPSHSILSSSTPTSKTTRNTFGGHSRCPPRAA